MVLDVLSMPSRLGRVGMILDELSMITNGLGRFRVFANPAHVIGDAMSDFLVFLTTPREPSAS